VEGNAYGGTLPPATGRGVRSEMASLREISDGMAGAVETAGTAVVQVAGRRGPAASGILWERGLVLTADHVVEGDEAQVTLANGSSATARVIGRDAPYDLAVLRSEGIDGSARFSGAALRTGELVLAVGRPRQLESTLGVVNAIAASRGGGSSLGEMIHTDAPLNRGFSGGPLVDADGAVVGFNSWHYGRGNTRALPAETLLRVASSLRDHGRLRRAYLGVGTQPVYLSDDARTAAGQDSGLMVVSMAPGGPAAAGGLLQGDTIIRVGEATVAGMRDLVRALAAVEAGSAVRIRVIRAGQVTEIEFTTGDREAAQES
jgi:S1-C subfamily serine protease